MAWSRREDDAILRGVEKYGLQSWAKVASLVPTRTSTQVRSRYYQALDSQSPWSATQDKLLLERHRRFPGQWATIASCVNKTAKGAQERYLELTRTQEQAPPPPPPPVEEDRDESAMDILSEVDASLERTSSGANLGRKHVRKVRERSEKAARDEAQIERFAQGRGALPSIQGAARPMGPLPQAPRSVAAISVRAIQRETVPVPAAAAATEEDEAPAYRKSSKENLMQRLGAIWGPKLPVLASPLQSLDELLAQLSGPSAASTPARRASQSTFQNGAANGQSPCAPIPGPVAPPFPAPVEPPSAPVEPPSMPSAPRAPAEPPARAPSASPRRAPPARAPARAPAQTVEYIVISDEERTDLKRPLDNAQESASKIPASETYDKSLFDRCLTKMNRENYPSTQPARAAKASPKAPEATTKAPEPRPEPRPEPQPEPAPEPKPKTKPLDITELSFEAFGDLFDKSIA